MEERSVDTVKETLRKRMEAYQHIARIRADRFGIGRTDGHENPLAATLHKTVTLLSAALYQKEYHFILELIQNAEDNAYPEHHSRYINFFLMKGDPLANDNATESTSHRIEQDVAEYTLVVVNNEVGFQSHHVDALCSAGSSTKISSTKGNSYIGEMGIGFKSVFVVSKRPCIWSNGYCFRFDEEPDPEVNLGYIVPYWIEQFNPSFQKKLKSLEDKTCILLPLKRDRFDYVQRQLQEIPPETILFLQKLDKILVYDQTVPKHLLEDNAMAVTREDSGNGIVRLRSRKKSEAHYFLYKEEFPVFENISEEKRPGVKTWTITLAFPLDDMSTVSHSIFSFLPTEVESGWPFLVNADLILVASRETFHVNKSWNQGILASVVESFVHGYLAMQTNEAALSRLSSKYSILGLIPTSSHTAALEPFRQSMLEKLSVMEVVPVSSIYYSTRIRETTIEPGGGIREDCKMQFCSPDRARFVNKQFLQILFEAKAEGLSLPSSLGDVAKIYLIDDIIREKYHQQLMSLGVKQLSMQEYVACILDRNWCLGLSDHLYVKLLRFLMQGFTAAQQILFLEKPFVRVYQKDRSVDLAPCSLSHPVYFPQSEKDRWLFEQDHKLQYLAPIRMLPASIYQLIRSEADGKQLLSWLKDMVHISELSAQSYAKQLLQAIQTHNDVSAIFKVTELLRLALDKKLISVGESVDLKTLPIVAEQKVVIHRKPKDFKKIVLLPRAVSEWPLLLDDDDPKHKLYIKLSSSYMDNWLPDLSLKGLAGQHHVQRPSADDTQARITFLRDHLGAKDLLDIDPHPHWWLRGLEKGLSNKQASLLIRWISKLCVLKGKVNGIRCLADSDSEFSPLPSSLFIKKLKDTSWLPTTHGLKKPEQAFTWTLALEKTVSDLLPYVLPEALPDEKEHITALHLLGVKQEVSSEDVLEILKKSVCEPATKINKVTIDYLYKYLHNNVQEFQPNFLLRVWVPEGTCGNSSSSWLIPSDCMWNDPSSLFQGKYAILSTIYDRSLEAWFMKLGVASEPRVELYLNKWLEICQASHHRERPVNEVSMEVAEKIWSKIASHVNAIRQQKEKLNNSICGIKLPTISVPYLTITSDGDEQKSDKGDESVSLMKDCQRKNSILLLKSANEVFISDNLYLEKVFLDKYPLLPIAWLPSSLGLKEVHDLHLLYKELGALSLSEATRMHVIEPLPVCSTSSYVDVDFFPVLAKPLFLVVMGFLSSTLTGGLQCQESIRREILLPLMQSLELNVQKVEVNYQLYDYSSPNQPKLIVEVHGLKAAYWDREKKVLYRTSQPPDSEDQGWVCHDVDASVDLARTLSSILPCSIGLEVIQKFEEYLLPFAMQEFRINSVLQLLRSKNIRVLECDEKFIDDFLTTNCPNMCQIGTKAMTTKKRKRILQDARKEQNEMTMKQEKVLKATETVTIPETSATVTEAKLLASQTEYESGYGGNRVQSLDKIENGFANDEFWKYLNGLGILPSIDLSGWMVQLRSIFSSGAGSIESATRLPSDKVSCLDWWIKDSLPEVKNTLGFLGSTGAVEESLDNLLLLAFLHSSYFNSREASYERLEHVGDAWLGAVISSRLFLLHPEADEGHLSKMKSMLVCNHTNNLYLRAVNLDRFIIMGTGDIVEDEQQDSNLLPRDWNRRHGVPNKVAADVVESVLAAVLFAFGSQGPAEADRVLFDVFIRGILTSSHLGCK